MADILEIDWLPERWLFRSRRSIPAEGDFYAVVGIHDYGTFEPSLLYVGSAYGQPVVERLCQPHVAFQRIPGYELAHPGRIVAVMIGKAADSNRMAVHRSLVEAAEALLINEYQPLFNTSHIESYSRRPLVVENTGARSPFSQYAATSQRALNQWA
jgi:hypothetical protein